jgi:hypothetical protein
MPWTPQQGDFIKVKAVTLDNVQRILEACLS